MKNHLITIALGLLAIACSKDDQPIPRTDNRVSINLSMVETLQPDIDTRRPVYSQEALQNINKMDLYIFQQSGADYLYSTTHSIPWTQGNATGNYTLPASLPAGNYKFLVVGRETTDSYTLSPLISTTTFDNFSANIDHASGKQEGEIFSGSQSITIVSQGARVDITCTRQVAGILGYFQNVPKSVNATPVRYLRLMMSASNSSVNLTTSAGGTPSGIYKIYEADLTTQGTNDSVFLGNTIGGVIKLPLSQLNGAFLIPANNTNITLGLYDNGGNLLKSWPVKSGGLTTFNILANNFYSLGRKLVAGATNGGDPSNPNNNDYAIDLLHDLEIAITINPNWNVIYTLPLQ